MAESNNVKLGAYCSIALHAAVALAAIVAVFVKTVLKTDEQPQPPVVFDMVEPSPQPEPEPAPAPAPQETQITQPKIEEIEKLDIPEPQPEPEPAPEPEPEPAPAPEPEPAPAPQPKPAPKPNPTPKPKQQKRISYKDFLKKNPEKRNPKPQRQRTTQRKVKVGSVKSSFSNINQIANISASATTGAAMKNELAAYAQYIHSMAKRNWVPPQDLYEELETEISFVVSKSGVISAFRIIRSSGNSAFDNSVATTFKSISLMPPPDKQQHTITLTFSSVD